VALKIFQDLAANKIACWYDLNWRIEEAPKQYGVSVGNVELSSGYFGYAPHLGTFGPALAGHVR
jgi:hypothetical protein